LLTSTSIASTDFSISATIGPIAAVSVTSSTRPIAWAGFNASNSFLALSLRTVPTTRSPLAKAASASARPNPVETPVMRRILLMPDSENMDARKAAGRPGWGRP
jgi:hypothetical protein